MSYLTAQVTLDGTVYNVLGPVRQTQMALTPDAILDSPDPKPNSFLPHQVWSIKNPYSLGTENPVGLTAFEISGKMWDEYNVNSLFPGAITRGPQKQTPTWTGGPVTFKVKIGQGFAEGLDRLWMFGNGAALDDEPVWYLNGTTWTNGTLNADFAADVRSIGGMVSIGDVLYALSDVEETITAAHRVFQSSSLAVWTTHSAAGTADGFSGQFGASTTRGAGLVGFYRPASNEMALGTSYVGGIAWQLQDTPATGGLMSIDFTTGGAAVTELGILSWQDDLYGSTTQGLYLADQSRQYRIWDYQNQDSVYTGQIELLPGGGGIVFTDGPALKVFTWDAQDKGQVIEIPWPNLPLDAQGDITAIAVSKEQPWVYVARGGLAASRNARIWVYNLKVNEWHCIYRGATAQRAITALHEFNDRLWMMEEQAAGGDQDPFYFDNIVTNPVLLSTYPYAASGVVTTPWFYGTSALIRKGFFKGRAVASNLSASKEFSIAVASDGGALGTAQIIDSATSPPSIWLDGAGAVGVDAQRIRLEITLQDTAANSTAGPTLHTLDVAWLPQALKDDDTIIREWDVFAILEGADDPTHRKPETILADLVATAAKRVLATFSFGPKTDWPNDITNAKVRAAVQGAQLASSIEAISGMGYTGLVAPVHIKEVI